MSGIKPFLSFSLKEINEFARIIIATLFAIASVSVHATPERVALAGSNSDTTFVNRAAVNNEVQYFDEQVLRNFAETITFSSNAKTGTPMCPHRSVTLTYKVDWDANRLVVGEWQTFDGNPATGQLVWNQKNVGRLDFSDAVDVKMRTACATNTVLR
ncbi:MAG: hypothetical protein JSW48_02520 [Betaproteobacteria bacterium]|nr:MAG: hypothetical protein JSW48_02520 [Betaproteobacteria bacterium]